MQQCRYVIMIVLGDYLCHQNAVSSVVHLGVMYIKWNLGFTVTEGNEPKWSVYQGDCSSGTN